MKRSHTLLALLAVALTTTGTALAADDCCPADAQADTSAHADCPMPHDNTATVIQTGATDAGDTDAACPVPHDTDSKTAAPAPLPDGHPSMDDMNQSVIGTLVIKATQGTWNGAPVADDPVRVELYQNGKPIHELNVKLDETGVVMIEDIAFTSIVQPVVTIRHGGVDYRTVAHPMAAVRPDQVVKITVYEPTDTPPEWTMRMRHMIVRAGPLGLEVTEMISLNNPTDRTWPGEKVDGCDKPATLVLPIPPQATHVQLGPGADPDLVQIEKDRVISHAPLMPGASQLAVGYILPPSEHPVHVAITTPADVEQMMLFVSANTDVEVEGLKSGQMMNGEDGPMQVYSATSIKAGDTLGFMVNRIETTAPQQPAEPAVYVDPAGVTPVQSSAAPQLIAGVGAGVVVLFAVALMFIKTPRKAA